MQENDQRDLESLFAQVQDSRMERTKLHRLQDIIILAICGVLCGAEGWAEVAYGQCLGGRKSVSPGSTGKRREIQ
jgi:hypothetical protein